MEACDAYVAATSRRVSYEYVLLSGVNDSDELAHELGQLLQGRLAHVNLIPVNPTPGTFSRPATRTTLRFQDIVHNYGIRTTVRAEKGVEISAACGQLATGAAAA
jgi:23S rRNA (adenine2503-C2)-methyltransferase